MSISDDNPSILIATDRVDDAEAIERALVEEFARVHVSTNPRHAVQDFDAHQPAVLVLAFQTLEKAERHLHNLRLPSLMVNALAHRVLILCGQDDLREVYEHCKTDHFDDFILFWPRTKEMRPLRMAVRRALRQVMVERLGMPGGHDFALRLRRLSEPRPLSVDTAAPSAGADLPANDRFAPWLEAVRGLRALAERCQPLVVVVDDDRFQHKILGQMLASAKVEMAFFTTAAEAIASLHKRRPDLILMDVNLPDVDGIKATRLLKSSRQFAAIPVIMITGVGGKTIVVDSLEAGAVDFVVKPFDKAILLGKVQKLLYGQAAA